LTSKEIDDGVAVAPLLDQVSGPLSSFTADGAYDQDGVYAVVAERHPEAAVIVPPRRTAVQSDMAVIAPTQRDRHLECIAEKGRMAWQKTSGYSRRAKVEAAIGRWKQVIGDGLRSHVDACRATEVEVAVHVLNRMSALGRANYVRIV
jgi:ribonuclease HII